MKIGKRVKLSEVSKKKQMRSRIRGLKNGKDNRKFSDASSEQVNEGVRSGRGDTVPFEGL